LHQRKTQTAHLSLQIFPKEESGKAVILFAK